MKELMWSLLIALLCFTSVAKAQPLPGDTAGAMRSNCVVSLELMNRLGNGEDAGSVSDVELGAAQTCLNLWRGIASMLAYNCWSRSQGYDPMFAAEAAVSPLAGIAVFVSWVDTNPESVDESAIDVMIGSLISGFPCEQTP